MIVRRIYDWVLSWADSRYGFIALLVVAFCESSFFPIPPDVLLIPLVLGATHRYWHYALGTTIASVVGGLFGYGIGFFAWQTLGRWLVEKLMAIELLMVDGRQDIALPGYLANILGERFLFQTFDTYNAWVVFVFGLTPLPYKLVTIAAGFAQTNPIVFAVASVVSRGLRFFVVAYLIYRFGELAKRFIDKYLNLLAIIFCLLLIGGFLLMTLVFKPG